jgi:hypothetical protein
MFLSTRTYELSFDDLKIALLFGANSTDLDRELFAL